MLPLGGIFVDVAGALRIEDMDRVEVVIMAGKDTGLAAIGDYVPRRVMCAHGQPLSESRKEKKTLFRHKPEQWLSFLEEPRGPGIALKSACYADAWRGCSRKKRSI